MKKSKIAAAILAGFMMFSGAPAIGQSFVSTSYAANAKLAAPTGFSATKTDTSIMLNWKSVQGADAYRVYMYSESEGKYKKYKNVSGIKCNVTGLKANTAYKFKVAALVKSGDSYAVQTKSSALSVTTASGNKLAAPKNIKAETTSDSITLSWDKVSGADAYRVYKYDKKTEKYKAYKIVASTRCTVMGLNIGTTYKFRIAALVKNGNSYIVQTKSEAVSATTIDELILTWDL